MNIENLTSYEQMELYKKETGANEIDMFAFNEWLLFTFINSL